jgi:hypothetical protein
VLGRLAIAAAVLALCLLAPAVAPAAEEDEGAIAAFRLNGSNGYRVLVLASRDPGKARGDLLIFVGSKHGGVSYGTTASVEESGIRADLGELGMIDLAFVPLKGKERHECGPGGEVSRIDRGEYRGIVELHGEEGYTEARATRLVADFGIFLELVCGGTVTFGDSTGPGLPGARFSARLHRGRDTALSLEIKKNRPSAPSAFAVLAAEQRGDIRIRRTMEGIVGPGAFSYDRNLRTATVSPPAPFDGSATFRREAPRRNRWTGDLTVDLPGRADTPLTGDPGFRTRLVHASWSKSREKAFQRPALGHPLALLEAP